MTMLIRRLPQSRLAPCSPRAPWPRARGRSAAPHRSSPSRTSPHLKLIAAATERDEC